MEDAEVLKKLVSQSEEMLARFDSIESLLKIAVRARMGNKQEKLYDKLQQEGRLSVAQAQNFLGCSRPHALTLLKKLSNQPGVSIRIGDASKNLPTVCLFDKSKVLADQFHTLHQWINERGEFRIGDVVSHFALLFADARNVVLDFCQANPEFTLDGFLCRRKP